MMGRLLFWAAVVMLAVLCPLSWRLTSATSDPAWFGLFVNNHLTAIRIVTSLGLAGLLGYSVWPQRRRAPDEQA